MVLVLYSFGLNFYPVLIFIFGHSILFRFLLIKCIYLFTLALFETMYFWVLVFPFTSYLNTFCSTTFGWNCLMFSLRGSFEWKHVWIMAHLENPQQCEGNHKIVVLKIFSPATSKISEIVFYALSSFLISAACSFNNLLHNAMSSPGSGSKFLEPCLQDTTWCWCCHQVWAQFYCPMPWMITLL